MERKIEKLSRSVKTKISEAKVSNFIEKNKNLGWPQPILHKSVDIAESRHEVINRSTQKPKKRTVAYNNWEIYEANQEPRNKINNVLQGLSRKMKNPHGYVGNVETEEEQKALESHLLKAFRKIHDD